MVSGGGRQTHADNVCLNCKLRKKKCDKALPSCRFCVRKGWDCDYDSLRRPPAIQQPRHPSQQQRLPYLGAREPGASSEHVILTWEPAATELSFHLQVQRIIRETDQFVDDISAHYFQGLHRYIPVVCRRRFHDSLITLGASPSADFSILLLVLCLVTYKQPPNHTGTSNDAQATGGQQHQVTPQSLYLATSSLFAQARVCFQPSLHLVQAGLLLAVYEYLQGRPDDAFISIANCARMAYAIRLHESFHGAVGGSNNLMERKTAANTWWAIVICEREFYNEVTVSNQPLTTVIPDANVELPTEPAVLDRMDVTVSYSNGPAKYDTPSDASSSPRCLNPESIKSFGRAAQAARLSDTVLKTFEIADLDTRLLQLNGLDTTMRAFLAVLLEQCQTEQGVFCGAIATSIRVLYILHQHILRLDPNAVSITAHFKSLEEWQASSRAALDTATKMVIDIAESHQHIVTTPENAMPPSYAYAVRAALQHIKVRRPSSDDAWLQGAEAQLRASLSKFNQRWGVWR
ncbi:hypothetical protein BX600DRAFT_56848 [Xylariales sp. PMI_506]|nr:hypothetical protein BX600DRAFT_56848 [Xylariales sp. PMI_506]